MEGPADGQPTAQAELVLAENVQQGGQAQDGVEYEEEEGRPDWGAQGEDPRSKAHKRHKGGDLRLEVFQEELPLIR